MANAHRIAREVGITLHSRKTWRPSTSEGTSKMLPAKNAWCCDAIVRVAKAGIRAGDVDHVYNVLGLLVASETGRQMLFAEVIKGTSKWVLANRINSAEIPFLMEPFGLIDLRAVRDEVVNGNIPYRSVQIALLISFYMQQHVIELRR